MQLFQVKSPDGELIMNAPLETIQKVWRVNSHVIMHLLRYTARLDQEYVIHFAAEINGWPKSLCIQRLPLEIPAQSAKVERLQAEAQATTETEFGRLLCDD